ncbi:diacylglycerol kinase [Chloroflexi bacterium TSY]|nr:diacylglycerol kinase [Chloroflexi bacterium TSY]
MLTKRTDRRWKRFDPQDMVRVSLAGLRFAISHDRNVAIQMFVTITVLLLAFWLRQWFDFVLLLIVTGHMLVTEMVNTAIEAICDYIQPDYDPRIGLIKDIAAAASGIAIVIWVVTIIYELMRIWSTLQDSY